LGVPPWWKETWPPGTPPILQVLRGDFFCLPFGANATAFRGERHLLHGETANARWRFGGIETGRDRVTLRLTLRTRVRPGRVEKRVSLVHGHNVVYCQHVVSGMRGPMCYGHHAMLRFPDRPGSGVLSCSGFKHGLTPPEPIERPEARGYSLLQPGSQFKDLRRVPTVTGERADLSRFPARRGFEDVALLVTRPRRPFAWVAMTFPTERYVWFALKDADVLRATLLWFSNGGRHYPPWNGRHVNLLGIEDITGYFHYGLAESARANPLTRRGEITCRQLAPDQPLVVNYVMGLALVPAGFDRVARLEPQAGADAVVLTSAAGARVCVPLHHGFVQTGKLGG
jgi:hypothetical protein